MLTRDGRIVWVRDEAVLRRDAEGRPRYDGLLIDVTDRKRIESQLQFFAEHDHLTGFATGAASSTSSTSRSAAGAATTSRSRC